MAPAAAGRGGVWAGADVCALPARAPDAPLFGWRLATEVVSEFAGTLLFTAVGSSARSPALTNGLALAAVVFALAPVSGAKLNPTVSAAAALADVARADDSWRAKRAAASVAAWRFALEAGAQIAGAFAGVAVAREMAQPAGVSIACFTPPTGTSQTVVGVNEENGATRFGVTAPIAAGFALYAAADAAGRYSGGARPAHSSQNKSVSETSFTLRAGCFNPARYIAGTRHGDCAFGWHYAGAYIGGQFLGAACALLLHFAILYGVRRTHDAACAPPPPPHKYASSDDGAPRAPLESSADEAYNGSREELQTPLLSAPFAVRARHGARPPLFGL